jgi:hypothetical protein
VCTTVRRWIEAWIAALIIGVLVWVHHGHKHFSLGDMFVLLTLFALGFLSGMRLTVPELVSRWPPNDAAASARNPSDWSGD